MVAKCAWWGLILVLPHLTVNHKAFIFELRQLGVGGPFLSILTEFLSNRLQRVVVDGQFNEYQNVISDVPQGSVLGPLISILYTHDMWFGLENILAPYADDATLLAHIPSPNMRSDVTESLNSMSYLRGRSWFLEIVFVGQCEVLVCLCFVVYFFFSLGREAHRSENRVSIL